mmetsp:Transcript_38809/g.91539  ORF Transcript_38809/g.91539 Transcript_38809/m.91539 type:complete len:234 (-) Transcript_38809:83-784(-)
MEPPRACALHLAACADEQAGGGGGGEQLRWRLAHDPGPLARRIRAPTLDPLDPPEARPPPGPRAPGARAGGRHPKRAVFVPPPRRERAGHSGGPARGRLKHGGAAVQGAGVAVRGAAGGACARRGAARRGAAQGHATPERPPRPVLHPRPAAGRARRRGVVVGGDGPRGAHGVGAGGRQRQHPRQLPRRPAPLLPAAPRCGLRVRGRTHRQLAAGRAGGGVCGGGWRRRRRRV